MKEVDCIIIGAGPAGCLAAVQCTRLGMQVLLLEKTGHLGGLIRHGSLIENFPSNPLPVTVDKFCDNLGAMLLKFNISLLKEEAVEVKKQGQKWCITCKSTDFFSKNVILATGTKAVRLNCELEKQLSSKLYYNFLELLAAKPGKVAIIGGGEASMDYALNLCSKNIKVSLLCRNKQFKARGVLVEKLRKSKIKTYLNTTLTGITDNTDNNEFILSTQGKTNTLQADAVLIAIGRSRILPLIGEVMILEDKILDLSLEKGLFICGDARLGSLGQVGIAIGDGLLAASMCTQAKG